MTVGCARETSAKLPPDSTLKKICAPGHDKPVQDAGMPYFSHTKLLRSLSARSIVVSKPPYLQTSLTRSLPSSIPRMDLTSAPGITALICLQSKSKSRNRSPNTCARFKILGSAWFFLPLYTGVVFWSRVKTKTEGCDIGQPHDDQPHEFSFSPCKSMGG
jgi:hypothetical protein